MKTKSLVIIKQSLKLAWTTTKNSLTKFLLVLCPLMLAFDYFPKKYNFYKDLTFLAVVFIFSLSTIWIFHRTTKTKLNKSFFSNSVSFFFFVILLKIVFLLSTNALHYITILWFNKFSTGNGFIYVVYPLFIFSAILFGLLILAVFAQKTILNTSLIKCLKHTLNQWTFQNFKSLLLYLITNIVLISAFLLPFIFLFDIIIKYTSNLFVLNHLLPFFSLILYLTAFFFTLSFLCSLFIQQNNSNSNKEKNWPKRLIYTACFVIIIVIATGAFYHNKAYCFSNNNAQTKALFKNINKQINSTTKTDNRTISSLDLYKKALDNYPKTLITTYLDTIFLEIRELHPNIFFENFNDCLQDFKKNRYLPIVLKSLSNFSLELNNIITKKNIKPLLPAKNKLNPLMDYTFDTADMIKGLSVYRDYLF